MQVALVGRVNVGKSTLFNRLVGRRSAIAHKTPSLTRDLREGAASIADISFTVLDTPGVVHGASLSAPKPQRRPAHPSGDSSSSSSPTFFSVLASDGAHPGATTLASMMDKVGMGVGRADLVLMVTDMREGLAEGDREIARWLRKQGKPVVLVGNKAEGKVEDEAAMAGLGLGAPLLISAEHGTGMQDLYLALWPVSYHVSAGDRQKNAANPPVVSEDAGGDGGSFDVDPGRPVQMAVVGKPNAGKSTLTNRLLGQDRMVVGPEPGVTRDAVRTELVYRGTKIGLVDTAGVRKLKPPTKDDEDLVSRECLNDTLRAVRTSTVAVVVIDHRTMSKDDDLQQLSTVIEEGRGLVVAVNKWDLIKSAKERLSAQKLVSEQVERYLGHLGKVEVAHISAETGAGVSEILPAVLRVHERLAFRLSTHKLMTWLADVTRVQPPPRVKGYKVKIRFITQAPRAPPTFVLFLNTSRSLLPGSYVQFLVSTLRKDFDLQSVPVRIVQRLAEHDQPEEADKDKDKEKKKATGPPPKRKTTTR
jgi:GTP-binding protein